MKSTRTPGARARRTIAGARPRSLAARPARGVRLELELELVGVELGLVELGRAQQSRGDPNATLIVNNSVPIATLDPNFTTNDQDPGFDGAMYSTLTQVTHEPGKVAGTEQQNLSISAVKPYLAQSYAFSNGNKTLTFHLRPGLKFPSGDPVDAKAVVWSLNRVIKAGERRLLGARGNRLHATADHFDQGTADR